MARRKIGNDQRRALLGTRHRLATPQHIDDPAAITNDLVALHSSDPATVFLSVMARMRAPTIEAVQRALYADRTIVRHHAMRRTLWVMAPHTAALAHAAATAKIARNERKKTLEALQRAPQVRNAAAWLDSATAEVVALVESSAPVTTRAIGQQLPHLVIPLEFGSAKASATVNAHTKVLQGAGFDALLVRGQPQSWRSSAYPWTTTKAWLGRSLTGREDRPAAAELLDQWLRRFGPATETDMKWWFGWTATLTRAALADSDAEPVEVETGPAWVATGDALTAHDAGPWVRLLPGLDPSVMGWKERDWYLNPELVPRLFDRFGNAGPTIWASGRVVGGWIQDEAGRILIDLAETLDTTHRALLDEAVGEMEAILGDTVVRPRFPSRSQKALLA